VEPADGGGGKLDGAGGRAVAADITYVFASCVCYYHSTPAKKKKNAEETNGAKKSFTITAALDVDNPPD